MKADVEHKSDTPPCSADFPEELAQLVGRCEINENTFTNADMSLALKFGQMLFRRLTLLADSYDRMAANFLPDDIHATITSEAAKDMRDIVSGCVKDL